MRVIYLIATILLAFIFILWFDAVGFGEKTYLLCFLLIFYIPVTLSSHRLPVRIPFTLSIFVSLFLFLLAFLKLIEIKDALTVSLFLNLSVVLFIIVRFFNKKEEKNISENLENTSKRCHDMAEKSEKIKLNLDILEKKSLEVSSLYESIKSTSQSLNIDSFFSILADFVKTHFDFESLSLIILEEDQKNDLQKFNILRLKKLKALQEYSTDFSEELNEDEKVLMEHFVKKDTPILLVSGGGNYFLPSIVKNKDIEIIASFPLKVKKELIGVFTILEFNPTDFDNFLILSEQITLEVEKIKLYTEIQKMIITDMLTGLYTRKYFMEKAEEERDRAAEFNLTFSVLMIDIDNFKNYNDQYGHLAGDIMLKVFADTLKNNLREIDIIARYGGEEFILLLPDTDQKGAIVVAERLRSAIEDLKVNLGERMVSTTISIGVSFFPYNTKDLHQLVEKADIALYRAKKEGKNRVITYRIV